MAGGGQCEGGEWSLWWKSDFGLWGAAGSSAGSSRAESAAQLLVKRAKKVNYEGAWRRLSFLFCASGITCRLENILGAFSPVH